MIRGRLLSATLAASPKPPRPAPSSAPGAEHREGFPPTVWAAGTTETVPRAFPARLAQIRLPGRLRSALQGEGAEAFPVASFIAEPEAGEGPERRLRGSGVVSGGFQGLTPAHVAYDAWPPLANHDERGCRAMDSELASTAIIAGYWQEVERRMEASRGGARAAGSDDANA